MDEQLKRESAEDQGDAAAPASEAAASVPAGDAVLKAQCDQPAEALAEANAKAGEYLAGWKRAMADYANLKKESERAQGEFAKFAAARLASELLPVMDGFRKAFAPPANGAEREYGKSWADGVAAVRTQFESVMRNAGVTAIDAADIPFDPACHEAMMTEQRAGTASGTVLKVLENGYKMHDRVLRPAKVIVAE